MTITVLHNQSLLDLALQHTGTIESIFELAVLNEKSITDDMVAGTSLLIGEISNKDILNYYTAKGYTTRHSLYQVGQASL